MADDDLTRVQRQLRDYVFSELLRAPDSPAAVRIHQAIQDAIRQEIGKLREEIGVIERSKGVAQRLANIEAAIRMIAQRLDLATPADVNAFHSAASGMSEREFRRGVFGWLRKNPVAQIALAGSILAAVVACFVWALGLIVPPRGEPSSSVHAATTEEPLDASAQRSPTRQELIDWGWTGLIRPAAVDAPNEQRASTSSFCLRGATCDFAQADPVKQQHAVQAAMNAASTGFSCNSQVAVDGDIQGGAAATLSAVVRCISPQLGDLERYCSAWCELPAPVVPALEGRGLDANRKDIWMRPLLEWALIVAAAKEKAIEEEQRGR